MKMPKTNRDEVRANTFTVCCLEKEKKQIEEAARNMGLSLSSFVRLVLNSHFEQKKKGG